MARFPMGDRHGMEGAPSGAGYGGYGPEGDYGGFGEGAERYGTAGVRAHVDGERDRLVDEAQHLGRPRDLRRAWPTGSMAQVTRAGEGRYRGMGPRNYRRPDDRIEDAVHERLTRDPYVDATEVEVEVKDGEVTLRGTVPDRDAKWRAEDLALEVGGVREVHNELRVPRGATLGSHMRYWRP